MDIEKLKDDLVIKDQFNKIFLRLGLKENFKECSPLMVTSTQKEEGKSLACILMALSVSESTGKRCLLWEANWSRPSLHFKITEVSRNNLEKYLSADVDELIVPTMMENVDLLPAIKVIDQQLGSTELFEVHKKILRKIQDRYELIIIEAPSFEEIKYNDPLYLASFSKAVLFLIKARSTDKRMVRSCIWALKDVNPKIGIALNNVVNTFYDT